AALSWFVVESIVVPPQELVRVVFVGAPNPLRAWIADSELRRLCFRNENRGDPAGAHLAPVGERRQFFSASRGYGCQESAGGAAGAGIDAVPMARQRMSRRGQIARRQGRRREWPAEPLVGQRREVKDRKRRAGAREPELDGEG